MGRIRVLLAEDHTIVRKGLRSILGSVTDIEVVGEAADGREAVAMVPELRPDVVVMDFAMPNLNGLETTRQITRLQPEVNVVILSMHQSEEYVFQALRAGATGYVIKQAAPTELITAIQAAHRGESFLSPSISRTVIDAYVRRAEASSEGSLELLTDREREVLQLIAEGHPNRVIAEKLCISVKTVETHRAHLMDKLGIHSTAELARYAVRRGMIAPDE